MSVIGRSVLNHYVPRILVEEEALGGSSEGWIGRRKIFQSEPSSTVHLTTARLSLASVEESEWCQSSSVVSVGWSLLPLGREQAINHLEIKDCMTFTQRLLRILKIAQALLIIGIT
jgi:hypothetical protein